jgi:hypothetical protein
MESTRRPADRGYLAFGVLVLVAGIVMLAAQAFRFELGEDAWPWVIVVPGLALLVAGLLSGREPGTGLCIAGSIVTTVGLVLLYQNTTGHWESWAYAWALIPLAAGLALLGYGLFSRSSSMVRGGSWLAGIAALLLAIGAWFFEGVFARRVRPELIEWWPIAIVVVGVVLVLRAAFAGNEPGEGAPKQPHTEA